MIKRYTDIYWTSKGKHILKTTTLTFKENSVLIEVKREELGGENSGTARNA